MQVRVPIACGKYYDESEADLRAALDSCLAAPSPPIAIPRPPALALPPPSSRELVGLIVPHSSLQDSGRVAAAAYSLLAAQQTDASSVILLGTNHVQSFFASHPPACLSGAVAWSTPLGLVQVDQELCGELAAAGIPVDDGPHRKGCTWARERAPS